MSQDLDTPVRTNLLGLTRAELEAFVTYDRQMTRAAEALGLTVVAPA